MAEVDQPLASAVGAAATTREARVGAGALAALPDVVRRLAPRASCVIVCDANTWEAAGARAAELLGVAAEPVMLAGRPRVKPDAAIGRSLAARLARGVLPIAVGSGVINDLVKFAADAAGTTYVAVPTAASMDGYAASGAALRDGGFKRTFPCAAPAAVVADLDVIVAAPAAMAGWGYGDLAGKLVAGADWMLADALGEDPINPGPFAMVQDNLAAWLGEPAAIRRGERAAIGGLVRGLLVSGLAMQAHGNSRPASGSDHQFAHLWEMEEIELAGVPVAHGACVGIGCLSMLAAYEWLLRQDVAAIDPASRAARSEAPTDVAIAAAFPLRFMAENAAAETAAKNADPASVERRLRALRAGWPELAATLRARLPRAETVRGWLEAAGAPASAAGLGIPPDKHAADHARARLIRRRFTALDLLHDLGWLDAAVAALFGPGGFWARSRAVA